MTPRTLFTAFLLSLQAATSIHATEPPPNELLSQRAEAFAAAIRAPQGEALATFVREGLVDRLVGNLRDGLADAPKQLPVSRDSRFTMASGSKMFTAVAILQLAQAGKLKLSDPLAQHLPDFPNQDFARRATLHQLLTHTAGAGNYWDEAYEKAWGEITTLRQMLPFVIPHLEAKAPAEFSYSNSGFLLLGLVVDDLLRFADALSAGKLLDPAHLALLTQAHVSQGPPDSAYGYGTFVETKNGVRSFGHGGRAPGVQFEFKIYPQLDTVLIVMSNYDTIAGPELATSLDGLIRWTP